jgi:hypothetical protein
MNIMDILQISISDKDIKENIKEYDLSDTIEDEVIKIFNTTGIKEMIESELEDEYIKEINSEKEYAIKTYIEDILDQTLGDSVGRGLEDETVNEDSMFYLSVEDIEDSELAEVRIENQLKTKENQLLVEVMTKEDDEIFDIKDNLLNLLMITNNLKIESTKECKNFFVSLFSNAPEETRERIFDYLLLSKIKQEKY